MKTEVFTVEAGTEESDLVISRYLRGKPREVLGVAFHMTDRRLMNHLLMAFHLCREDAPMPQAIYDTLTSAGFQVPSNILKDEKLNEKAKELMEGQTGNCDRDCKTCEHAEEHGMMSIDLVNMPPAGNA